MTEITVDRLFRTYAEMELAGKKLRVRALSDFELQMRNREALKASVQAERRLDDKESTEYQVTLLPLESAEDDVLRSTLLAIRQREAIREAERELPLEYIPFPDEASPEEQREVIRKREDQDTAILDKRTERAKAILEAYQKTLADKPREQLLSDCKRKTASMFAEAAFGDEFVWNTVHMCTETPEGKRYFASLEEVKGASRQALTAIMEAFAKVNDIDPLVSPGPSAMDSPQA